MKPRTLLLVPGALLIAALVMSVGSYAKLRPHLGGRGPLEETPAATLGEVHEVTAALGVDGRSRYARLLVWDLAFIAANAAAPPHLATLLSVPKSPPSGMCPHPRVGFAPRTTYARNLGACPP